MALEVCNLGLGGFGLRGFGFWAGFVLGLRWRWRFGLKQVSGVPSGTYGP